MDQFLRRPNPAVVASIMPGGAPHSAATWYDWDEGRVLLNMDESRRRLDHLRRDGRVALTVLDEGTWYRHVSLIGHVASLERDPDLRDIDRLARRYTGRPYRDRERRSWSAWIEVERWHGWVRGRSWESSS